MANSLAADPVPIRGLWIGDPEAWLIDALLNRKPITWVHMSRDSQFRLSVGERALKRVCHVPKLICHQQNARKTNKY